jgi:signal transduction histidine kinase
MAKVLIVDDNPKNIQVLGNILSDEQYEIEFSRNGLEAVKRVEDEDFDIILLDIMMPVMDGFEACEKIKKMEGRAHIPVIFITAKADTDSISRGFALGAIDYIAKPFNAIELHAKVKTQIELKKNRDLLKSFNLELELKVQERTLSLKESNEKLKALNLRLAEVEELERRRIAENLHDTVGQSLALAFLKLSTLAPDSCEKGKIIIKEVSTLLNQAIEESRTITYDLSPPILYELGLIAALEWRLEQINAKQQIATQLVNSSNKLKIKKEFQVILYRIACELFANVIKHANASHIEVEIKEKRKSYKIFIRDNGVGFDTSKPIQSKTGGGFGLRSIKERLEAMNAKLKIDSVVGQGTKGIITIKKQK